MRNPEYLRPDKLLSKLSVSEHCKGKKPIVRDNWTQGRAPNWMSGRSDLKDANETLTDPNDSAEELQYDRM